MAFNQTITQRIPANRPNRSGTHSALLAILTWCCLQFAAPELLGQDPWPTYPTPLQNGQQRVETPASLTSSTASAVPSSPRLQNQTEASLHPVGTRALQPAHSAASWQPARKREDEQTRTSSNGSSLASLAIQPAGPSNQRNYQVKNLSYEEFEAKLIGIWGKRISGQALDADRTLRIHLPATKQSPHQTMVFDRMTRSLTFEGAPGNVSGWNRSMEYIDRSHTAAGGHACRLVDMNMAEPELIRQVTFTLGTRQEKDETPKQDDVRREIQLPPGTDRLQLPEIARQDEDDIGILNKVRIEVIPESGLIVLVGEDEDVARVEKLIKEIIQVTDTAKPSFEKIPLNNQKSETVAESIQEIYDANFSDQLGPATVTPFATPNSLFVVGTAKSIEVVKEIVQALDVESDADMGPDFKRYRLRYISAVDAKQRIDEYFGQATQNALVEPPETLPVYTIADYRSNTLIVKASQQLLRQVDQLIKDLDVDDSGAKNLIKIFPIRNVLAQDLQIVLQDAINGQLQNQGNGFNPDQTAQQQNQQNQGQQQDSLNRSQLRSAALEMMTIDRNGQKINGGIMFDVRITTSANDNSLVITGPAKAMPLIEELIKQLDRMPDAETLIKVFTIVNGDAQSLLDMLESLFSATQQQGGGGAQTSQSLNTLPLQSLSAGDGNSLVNLRFGVDTRTNSIVATGPEGDLNVVEDLLIRLDEDDIANRRVSVYRLSNAPVLDVSDAINAWLEERGSQTDTLVNNVLSERRDVILVPEVISNSLIVSARPEYYHQVESIIRALDRRPPMVKVKVLIAQVDLSYLEEFGVQFGLQDGVLWTPPGAAIDQSIEIGQNFIQGDNGLGNTPGQKSGNFPIDRTRGLLSQMLGSYGMTKYADGGGGLTVSAGNRSVDLLIRALKNKNCATVLSRPHIMTLENLQGRVQVGSRVPYQTGQTIANNGSVTNNIEFQDVGVILEITPRVTPDGMIVMFVNATSSKLGSLADGALGGGSVDGQPTFEQRPIDTTTAQTAIMAKSGQTVVFSGLLQETKEADDSGIPILMDLPYVGPLFQYQRDTSDRKELMIVMTPYLVDSDEDIEMANQDEVDRMHWCYCDVAEIYGDLSYADRGHVSGRTQIIYPDSDPTGDNPQFIQETKTGGQPLQPMKETSITQDVNQPPRPLQASHARPSNVPQNNPETKAPRRDSSRPIGTYFGPASQNRTTNQNQ
ncbi:MAG: hypothetical protein MK108_12515 [Mariniblastus sp.]|nr:hypothetical protein [Mariniblastus sp.]